MNNLIERLGARVIAVLAAKDSIREFEQQFKLPQESESDPKLEIVAEESFLDF